MADTVCVTGASGFVAGHVVRDLLAAGYRVRATLRDRDKAERVRRDLTEAGCAVGELTFAQADLKADAGWDEALADCRFVLHTASPFPVSQPRDRFALVPLARDGTLRVLGAARRAGAERFVVTSSIAAIGYGHPASHRGAFGEGDWTDMENPSVPAYPVSKTEAERAVWADIRANAGPDVVAVNPAFVLGPLLGDTLGTSAKLIRMMMQGRMPFVPDAGLGVVDVHDVASAHRLALETREAAGRRFIVSAGRMTLLDMARAVGEAEPDHVRRLPQRSLPDWVVRAAAAVSTQARSVRPELGRETRFDTGPARDVLGLVFREKEKAVADMAHSLVRRGLVTNKS